ncbi:MAG TPA: arginine--tRNA ligase [Firmicutes bacterium]|nr:arginine--tRNA ligase [Candidatus Fermentithermobacillaceae bacterium]
MQNSLSVLGQVKKDIAARITRAISKAQDRDELPKDINVEVKMEIPPRPEQGDFATGAAMALGRQAKMDGRTVAGIIIRHLDIDDSPVLRVDIAGPGFLNFFLDGSWLEKAMSRVWAEGPSYGRTDYLKGQKILLEFVSANPTGPLNVVNARAAAVGDCLASMLEMAGAEVSREFYVNDAGNQTDILGASLEARYRQALGQDYPLPENSYRGEYLKDMAAALAAEKGSSLLELPDGERHEFFKSYALGKIIEWQKKTLKDYGLTFDTWFSEKSLRDTGAHNQVVELLRVKGLTYEKDGALWFRSTQFGDDKDRVLVKSDPNASATYILPDLAYHKNKLERGFNHLIDILGPDHHGYVNRLAAGLMGLGYPREVLEVLIVQVVRLVKGKEVVKMSKRGGEFITMDELLEEVGKDAARFFFLMRSPESHLDFDIDLARLQSNENPVFYVQYAHARIASIFRQAKDDGFKFAMGPNEINFSLLRDPSELALMKIIAAFPEEVYEIAKAREPNRLIKYMMDLATAFHAFYSRCRVLGDDPDLTAARLYLAKLTQITLANALRLIGVSAPESM